MEWDRQRTEEEREMREHVEAIARLDEEAKVRTRTHKQNVVDNCIVTESHGGCDIVRLAEDNRDSGDFERMQRPLGGSVTRQRYPQRKRKKFCGI